MSSSGVQVNADVKIKYEELKKDKSYRFILCVIRDSKEIVVDRTGSREASYEDMLSLLSSEHPAYVIVDLEYNNSEGNPARKIVFLFWLPDTANIKEKMLYSSSKTAIEKSLVGIVSYQASDFEEASFNSISMN